MPSLLFETPGNPIPENAFAEMMTMPDGRRLRYARFTATGRPFKGTVVIFSGRNECIEKYFETIRDLGERGFGAAIFDWWGQGLSDRLTRGASRGYIDSFDDYVADIEPFFEHVVLPDCRAPFYLLGHSTGALIAMLAADQLAIRIRRMVLTAPLLDFVGLPFTLERARLIAAGFYALGLGRLYMSRRGRSGLPGPFATNVLTTDADRFLRNADIYREHPELATGGATFAWIHAACQAILKVTDPAFGERFRIPTLFVAAGADEVVSTPAIEAVARQTRGAWCVTIDGARHEIMQEADVYREQFLAAFDAFVPGTEVAALTR